MSGSLKGRFSHDLITEINGKQRRIESKAWESLVGYHKRYGQCIDGLCVVLSQEQFKCLLLGDMPEIIQSSDGLKQLHEFFNQDKYTDIVAIKTRGKPFIFCLSLNFFNELKEGG